MKMIVDWLELVRASLFFFENAVGLSDLLHRIKPYTLADTRGFFEKERSTSPSLQSCENEPWSQIVPSRELDYQPCFDGFQCARVDLPMDWNQTGTNDTRVQIAVAKLPAKVPVTDARYGGLLWLQDGGPGESGIDYILSLGRSFQMIVDSSIDPQNAEDATSSTSKFFDVIAIDSRGLNNSTPCFSCFPTVSSRENWLLESRAEGILGSSDVSFQNLWARAHTIGIGCSRKVDESDSNQDRLALHVNTTPQIADMVAILELHGRWRENEARHQLTATERSEEEALQVLERTRWKKDEEKLNFWGVSYGTVIGAAFASMQPHRVERVIFDGVVDTADYFTGHRLTALLDTDTIPERLAGYCYKAGPDRCPLYLDGGAAAIVQNFRSIIESLKGNPIGVPSTGTLGPQLITYSDVVRATFSSLYSPIETFPSLAQWLADISNGNITSSAASTKLHPFKQTTPPPTASKDPTTPYTSSTCRIQRALPGDTRQAILCSDSNDTFGMTQQDFKSYIETVTAQSPMFGGLFSQVRMSCVAWSLKAKWRFSGPYAGKTAYPILLVSNVADPVTPINSANTLARRFDDSRVLAVDGEGHCSLSAPSLCAAHHIRDYFQTGQLPPTGAVCHANEKTFLGVTDPGDAKDAKLLEELMFMARHWA